MPFGEELGASTGGPTTGMGFSNSGDNNRKKFTGYERDNETGLDFAQARYNSSTLGRFTSPDPFSGSMSAANPQSFNRYAYVGNNPVNAIDPMGLAGEHLGAGTMPGDESALGRLTGENGVFSTESWKANDSASSEPEEEATKDAEEAGVDGKVTEVTGQALPKNDDAAKPGGTAEQIASDQELKGLFTDGRGIVRGVGSIRNEGGKDTHYMLAGGLVHTIHLYGNEDATAQVNVYVPKSFSIIERHGSTVIATDPHTGYVLNCNHISPTRPQKANAQGSIYIGRNGGKGAERPGDIHAHITLYKSRTARDLVENWRTEPTHIIRNNTPGFTRTIDTAHAQYVLDFRVLIRK